MASVNDTLVFEMVRSQPVLPCSEKPVLRWLKAPCSSDKDCPVDNVQCYLGQCRCSLGYYFSVSSRTCIPDCSLDHLGVSFMAYRQHCLTNSTAEDKTGAESNRLLVCKNRCCDNAHCRSLDRDTEDGVCYLFTTTTDGIGMFHVPDVHCTHYHRT